MPDVRTRTIKDNPNFAPDHPANDVTLRIRPTTTPRQWYRRPHWPCLLVAFLHDIASEGCIVTQDFEDPGQIGVCGLAFARRQPVFLAERLAYPRPKRQPLAACTSYSGNCRAAQNQACTEPWPPPPAHHRDQLAVTEPDISPVSGRRQGLCDLRFGGLDSASSAGPAPCVVDDQARAGSLDLGKGQ